MQVQKQFWATIAVIGLLGGPLFASPAGASTSVSQADVGAFQPAGDGSGVLTPGEFFAPTSSGKATLLRSSDTIDVKINTSGLPPGAYTVWWVVWNNPEGCEGPCGEDDINSEAAENSIFWAGYDIVGENGNSNFAASYTNGDFRGGVGQNLIDWGDVDPATAEVHNIIKYHGPASDDPDTLHYQLTTVFGSCGPDEGANANAFGCPDFQGVAHPLP